MSTDYSGIRINNIVLAATHNYKKIKGKPLNRYVQLKQKHITTGFEPLADRKDAVKITVVFKGPKVEGRLEGVLDRRTGMISMDVARLELTSYLKKKRFSVMGYTLDARITTTNRRRRHAVV